MKLKTALQTALVLGYPDPTKPYVLDTDASKSGLRAVLSEVLDAQEHVIAYFSRTLTKQESNYCTMRPRVCWQSLLQSSTLNRICMEADFS